MAQPEAPKIIFSMLGVSKKIERKEILRDISLSFFYGAKIGVLGLNGSGKSLPAHFLPRLFGHA
jgi:ABC-type polysaccharide/polyol phosphate transport system ATPase subunit